MGAAGEEPTRDIPQMDAAARAELGALRVRAYGPDADIHDDPLAIARLEELERRAHEGTTGGMPEAAVRPDALDPIPGAQSTPPPALEVDQRRRARPGIRAALCAGVAAVVLLLGGLAAASALQRAPVRPGASDDETAYGLAEGSVVLAKILLSAQFGSYGTPPDDGPPDFPSDAPVKWTDFLGAYYGSDLWIGGLDDETDSVCIVVVHDARPRGTCEDRPRWNAGALFLAVPYVAVDPARRPYGLDPAQSLGFWWAPDDTVYIVRGPGSLAAMADVDASAAPAHFEALVLPGVRARTGARPRSTLG